MAFAFLAGAGEALAAGGEVAAAGAAGAGEGALAGLAGAGEGAVAGAAEGGGGFLERLGGSYRTQAMQSKQAQPHERKTHPMGSTVPADMAAQVEQLRERQQQ